MVRTLLSSQTLENDRTLQHVILVIGLCFMLGSVPLWLGVADQDYQFSLAGERTDLSPAIETSAYQYNQLPSKEQQIVDEAMNGKSFYFEDGSMDLPRFVVKSNTYYEFNSSPIIDWASPLSFGPIIIGIVGIWLTFEAIQHWRKQLGPFGY